MLLCLNACILQNSYVNPNPQMKILGDGALWKWLGHEGETLMNEINNLFFEINNLIEAPEISLAPFYHVGTQPEIAVC